MLYTAWENRNPGAHLCVCSGVPGVLPCLKAIRNLSPNIPEWSDTHHFTPCAALVHSRFTFVGEETKSSTARGQKSSWIHSTHLPDSAKPSSRWDAGLLSPVTLLQTDWSLCRQSTDTALTQRLQLWRTGVLTSPAPPPAPTMGPSGSLLGSEHLQLVLLGSLAAATTFFLITFLIFLCSSCNRWEPCVSAGILRWHCPAPSTLYRKTCCEGEPIAQTVTETSVLKLTDISAAEGPGPVLLSETYIWLYRGATGRALWMKLPRVTSLLLSWAPSKFPVSFSVDIWKSK